MSISILCILIKWNTKKRRGASVPSSSPWIHPCLHIWFSLRSFKILWPNHWMTLSAGMYNLTPVILFSFEKLAMHWNANKTLSCFIHIDYIILIVRPKNVPWVSFSFGSYCLAEPLLTYHVFLTDDYTVFKRTSLNLCASIIIMVYFVYLFNCMHLNYFFVM